MSMSSAHAGASRTERRMPNESPRSLAKWGCMVMALSEVQGHAFAVSVERERMATPWLTAALALLRGSVTAARTFHSLSAQSESPVVGVDPAMSMPGLGE